jgi:arabinose-5-phosphate isomerase
VSIQRAKEVIRTEAEAVKALEDRIDERFQKAVNIILNCKGRVIITGMGKSGIIAKKIASTLTSTGTASLFLHPAEGVHGDLGVVLKEDVVICISKSGNTEEILRLIPQFRKLDVPIIAMIGNVNSEMADYSDVILDVSVKEEACPFDLVPTASTTATLVMGDALALALFQERGFSVEDFAQFHPGGSIGRRLILQVDDIMRKGEDIAKVNQDTPLSQTILEITSKRLGATCVMNKNHLAGIITDGDLRRLMENKHDIWDLKAKDIMTVNPKCVDSGVLAVKALQVMEEYSINALIVVDLKRNPVGMVHIHDLLKAGVT